MFSAEARYDYQDRPEAVRMHRGTLRLHASTLGVRQ